MLDAENLAKGTIEIAGIGLGHAIGVTDEEHEGRRGHFRLREIEKLRTRALDHRRLVFREHFFHRPVERAGPDAGVALFADLRGERDDAPKAPGGP